MARIVHKKDYTVIGNQILRNESISWKAKGIFVYLCSKPNDWVFRESEIMKHATEGKDAFRSGIKELEKYGYLIRKSRKNHDGKFAGVDWLLNENPDNHDGPEKSDTPVSDNPNSESQNSDSPQLLSTDKPSTEELNTDITKKTSCSKLKFATQHMVLAELLQKKMKENNPNLKPQNLKSWANTFRLMMERDNRSFDDIKKVVLWCQQDSFWYKNILSADKLRKQYDRLTLEMKNPRGGRRNGNSEEDKYKNDLGYQWHLKNPGMPWRTTAERHAGIPAHY